MVLKILIFNSFYLGGVVIIKELIFNIFLLWEGVVVLTELIFNSFYFGEGVALLKKLFLTVSTLGGCGGLESIEF